MHCGMLFDTPIDGKVQVRLLITFIKQNYNLNFTKTTYVLLYFQVTDAAPVREYDVTEYVEGEVESGVHGNETGEKLSREASHAADKVTARQVIMWI